MKKFCIASFLLLFLLLTFSYKAQAASDEKNLKGRLGIGYTSQVAETSDHNIPAVSAKYYFSKYLAMSTDLGFDTRTGDSALALGAKIYKTLFLESNLIFYTGAGLAYLSHKGSYLQGSVFLGAEFFFSQLPSLGFTFETGIRGDSTSGQFAIRTTGDSFLTGGIRFYF